MRVVLEILFLFSYSFFLSLLVFISCYFLFYIFFILSLRFTNEYNLMLIKNEQMK